MATVLRVLAPLSVAEEMNLARLSQAATGVNIVLSADTPLPLSGGFRAEVLTGAGQNWTPVGAVEIAEGSTFPDKVLGDGTIIPNPKIVIGVTQTRGVGGSPDSPSFRNVLCRLVLTPLGGNQANFGLAWEEQ